MHVLFDPDFDGGAWPGPLHGREAAAGETWVGFNGLLGLLGTGSACAAPDGSVLRGAADLVLETADAWVLVDHKSFPGTREAAEARAQTHGGQLGAYAEAQAVASKPVRGFIHRPVTGQRVELSLAATAPSASSRSAGRPRAS